MIRQIAVAAALCSIAGCASIEPTSIPIGIEHVSHIMQHRPFTDHPTNFGYSGVFVGLQWQRKNFRLTAQEEYAKDMLDGRHEVFEARAEYDLPLR